MMTAEQFLTLRETLQAEVSRRNACGSLVAYGKRAEVSEQQATASDLTEDTTDLQSGESENIAPGAVILARDGTDVIEPLLAIQDYGDLVIPESGAVIPASFDESLITYVNELSKEPMTGAATSCRGACTGLCKSGCSNACSGCTGGCTGCGGCSGSCGTGCASGSRA